MSEEGPWCCCRAGTDRNGVLPLMAQAFFGHAEVARLLQDPRVRVTINVHDRDGHTALHWDCRNTKAEQPALTAHLLLHAGLNPIIADNHGQTPLGFVRQYDPTNHATIALLEQYPAAQKDAEKASLLIKARRLTIAATTNTVAPSCLQTRVARGQPLPRVTLMPLTGGNKRTRERRRKRRGLVGFLLGMEGGPMGEGMPWDVFRVVMDLLMPSWDPLLLRRGIAGGGISDGITRSSSHSSSDGNSDDDK